MKKLFLALCVALVSVSASAQKGQTAVGANVSYGTEISNIGFGVKGQYGITDAIRVEAGFDYFLKKDDCKFWNINLNAHYLFPLSDKLKVYPLVGLTYAHASASTGSIGEFNWGGKTGWEGYVAMCNDLGQTPSKEEYEEDYGALDGSSSSDSKFGVNLGAGLQYDLSDKWAVNVEAKYQLISDFNQAVFSVGLAYKF